MNTPGAFLKFDSPVAQPGVEACDNVDVKAADGTTLCTCRICYTVAANGEDIASFTSGSCSVAKVIIKASNEAKVWNYTGCPGGGSTGDTNLTGVTGHAISHITFCGITCCTPKTCATVPAGTCGSQIPDGCDGFIDCTCPTTCPAGPAGGGENNTCSSTTNGTCGCDSDTCADLPAGTECGTGFDDGCCGTFNCNCPTNCPTGTDDGPNNTCDNGTCVCTKNTCQSLGKTCGVHDDGCCGTIDCGKCFEGCTPGYFKNHPETITQAGYTATTTVTDVFGAAVGTCCPSLASKTLLQALSLRGGSGTCGAVETLLRAAVAALLNSSLVDYPLTTAQVIDAVQQALSGCNRNTILAEATRLDNLNNSKDADSNHNCPCNNQGCPS